MSSEGNNQQLPMNANLRVSPSNSQTLGGGSDTNSSSFDTKQPTDTTSSLSSAQASFYTSATNIDRSGGNSNTLLDSTLTNTTNTSNNLYGELLRGSGTVSAPPPGFSDGDYANAIAPDSIRQRQQRAEHTTTSLLMNSYQVRESNMSSNGFNSMGSFGGFRQDIAGGRSNSFANLAAALGEGLAESMDDSCQYNKTIDSLPSHPVANPNSSSSTFQSNQLQLNDDNIVHSLIQPISTVSSSTDNEREKLLQSESANPTTLSTSEINNYHRQGRHSASRLIRNLSEDNFIYSGSGILSVGATPSATQMDLVTQRTSNTSGNGVIRASNAPPDRLFQSTPTPASTANHPSAGVGMTVVEPQESYVDSSKDQNRLYNSLIGERNKASTPSSLARAVSQIKKSSQSSSSQDLAGQPAIFDESKKTSMDPILGRSTQHLLGLNQSSTSIQNHLSNTSQSLNLNENDSNGRASAPPNLFISSTTSVDHQRFGTQNQQQQQYSLKQTQAPDSFASHNHPTILDPRHSSSPAHTPEPTATHIGNVGQKTMLSTDQDEIAEFELEPFIHDTLTTAKKAGQSTTASQIPSKPSRGLVILGVSSMLSTGKIGVPEIQTTCEAFGALETFRTDFATTKGVIFVSYFNLLHAQHAAMELSGYLSRFAGFDNGALSGSTGFDIKVKYCIPLHASASKDDSLILLSNLPSDTDEDSLTSMMESYGAVKAVHYQMVSNDLTHSDPSLNNGYNSDEDEEGKENQAYAVEFFDIQDAKHALMELVNCQPLGKKVRVQRGMTNPTVRRKAIKLITLLGRWRQGKGAQERPTSFTPPLSTTPPPPPPASTGATNIDYLTRANERSTTPSMPKSSSPVPVAPSHPNGHRTVVSPGPQFPPQHAPAPQAQLLLSPDGQYSYVMVNPQHSQQSQVQHVLHPNQHPHFMSTAQVHNHHGVPHPSSQYWTTATHPMHQSSPYQTTHVVLQPGVTSNAPYLDARLVANPGLPLYANVPSVGAHPDMTAMTGSSHANQRVSAGRKGSSNSNKNRQSGDSSELALDITCVANGTDTRSSLMVRNIPNKYTQQMLLAEFAEFGHGSDKIDFFYLPIDFKNRCNRGYAFINFVDYQDIIPFHEQYNDKHWRVFNSDKVCAITYARIQGKAAMLKRFEHSALLDKNDEYRPLVFTSHGVNKGKRENFPSTSTSSDNNEGEK